MTIKVWSVNTIALVFLVGLATVQAQSESSGFVPLPVSGNKTFDTTNATNIICRGKGALCEFDDYQSEISWTSTSASIMYNVKACNIENCTASCDPRCEITLETLPPTAEPEEIVPTISPTAAPVFSGGVTFNTTTGATIVCLATEIAKCLFDAQKQGSEWNWVEIDENGIKTTTTTFTAEPCQAESCSAYCDPTCSLKGEEILQTPTKAPIAPPTQSPTMAKQPTPHPTLNLVRGEATQTSTPTVVGVSDSSSAGKQFDAFSPVTAFIGVVVPLWGFLRAGV